MTTPVIIDFVTVLLLLAAVWYGARRGLLRTLTGLVLVSVALVGARGVTAVLTEPVTSFAAPLVEERILANVEAAFSEQRPELNESSVSGLLAALGLDEAVRSFLAERVVNAVRDTGASVVSAVTENLVRSSVRSILFTVSFSLCLLALKLAERALGLVFRLPVLHELNALGGGLIGLLEGALLLFLAICVSRCLGVSFETPPLSETRILRIFTTHMPMGLWSFLQ